MKITEIEGLSYSELHKRRHELIGCCKEVDIAVLATRYVQARSDAAMRDEKMGKQGELITVLQSSLKAAEERTKVANETSSEHLVIADEALVEQARAARKMREELNALVNENKILQEKLLKFGARAKRRGFFRRHRTPVAED